MNQKRYEAGLQAALEYIAKYHLRIKTLETQNSDSLDFHDLAVWVLKDAIEEAYSCGYKDGQKDPTAE